MKSSEGSSGILSSSEDVCHQKRGDLEDLEELLGWAFLIFDDHLC
jgi:hypothetical protein